MALAIGKELTTMKKMTVRELKQKYEDVFGEACCSNHKVWLIKRISWRLQANEEGGLSERALRRAGELANDADLRMKAPPQQKQLTSSRSRKVQTTLSQSHDSRIPMPGTLLVRQYKGRTVQTTVLPNGFDYEGEVYSSLSAVAKAITGSHTSGFLFFQLNKKGSH